MGFRERLVERFPDRAQRRQVQLFGHKGFILNGASVIAPSAGTS